jgi:hypothetical protein
VIALGCDDRPAEEVLAEAAERLAAGVEAALPGWVERQVHRRLRDAGMPYDDHAAAAAAAAGAAAAAEFGPRVRELLARDIDAQAGNPLALLRDAVVHPTGVLRSLGVPPVGRDEFAERVFPGDVYDLHPASFADLDPALHEPGLHWGAAKAFVHLRRRRGDGGPGTAAGSSSGNTA